MSNSSFYTQEELEDLGFKKLGKNVLISKKVSIYGADKMEIGNNVRIDDFCFLMGKIIIGNHVHIAPYSNLVAGNAGIEMQDFSGISSRVSVYAVSDDYSGEAMTNPTVPEKYTNVISAPVIIEKHSIIGASSVILPGVTVRIGSSCGSMTLVNKSTEPWSINVGIPARKVSERKKNLLDLERKFQQECNEEMKKDKFYVGQKKIIYKTISEDDIYEFAKASGDNNPIHIDENYAKNTIFRKRIAHGMLSGAYISAVLGNEFPGKGTIYLEQNIKFVRPVFIGDKLEISIKIIEITENRKARLITNISNQDKKIVVEGEAMVKLPK